MQKTTAISVDGEQVPIAVRPYTDDDQAFVYSTWLRSYRDSDFARMHSDTVYFQRHAALIDRLLIRSQTLIACAPDAPSVIFGWACGKAPVLHYVYVKRDLRRHGIAKLLTEQLDVGAAPVVTHRTRHFTAGVFNAYALGDTL